MAYVVADRVLETSTFTGTSDISLAGARTGYQPFSLACADLDIVNYSIVAVDSSDNPTGQWETGIGLYSASANTISRMQIAWSSTGGKVNFSSGTKLVSSKGPSYVFSDDAEGVAFISNGGWEIVASLQRLNEYIEGLPLPSYKFAASCLIDVFTANETWTKRTGLKSVTVVAIGGGGGGGSGRFGASGSASYGGGGAGGGACSTIELSAALLGSTESVIVGSGGAGGAARTAVNNGIGGDSGGDSAFGSWLVAKGGNAGSPGGASMGASGSGGTGLYDGGTGGASQIASVGSSGRRSMQGGSGGGGGGGIDASNSVRAGGIGGGDPTISSGTTAIGGGAVANMSADDRTSGDPRGGNGGGGGSASLSTGNAGGQGGFPGGGGGGGGATQAVSSGAGGTGGGGVVIVFNYF